MKIKFREHFRALAAQPSKPPKPTVNSIWINRLDRRSFLAVLAAVAIVGLSYFSGQGSASNQRIFFEQIGTNSVLVAVDGSNFVTETVQGDQLTGTISIVPFSRGLEFTPVVIGPLKTPVDCTYNEC